MRIAMGADHAGFVLKTRLAAVLRNSGHEVLDVGTHSEAPVDYPDFAESVGLFVHARFCGEERHARRLDKLRALEARSATRTTAGSGTPSAV